MLGQAEVNSAIETAQAVSDIDDFFTFPCRRLCELVDRPVCNRVPDETGWFARKPQIVLGRASVDSELAMVTSPFASWGDLLNAGPRLVEACGDEEAARRGSGN